MFLIFIWTPFLFQFLLITWLAAACRTPINKSTLWANCKCQEIEKENEEEEEENILFEEEIKKEEKNKNNNKIKTINNYLNCNEEDWLELPLLNEIWEKKKEGNLQNMQQPNNINILTIKNTKIRSLGQDVFRTEPKIRKLDLSQNKIEILNANTFRGLEVNLLELILKSNKFHSPSLEWLPSFTHLQNLEKLNLEDNKIENFEDFLFNIKLNNLQFLHLDFNKVSIWI
uniref:Uncharacterized protein n=1 Tax=Meloidogyne enterolobii TaxID=390850 RepID=A0A6V7TQ86_MELEN|nr:unnamed protein product [Meloidogyne enterolobii]